MRYSWIFFIIICSFIKGFQGEDSIVVVAENSITVDCLSDHYKQQIIDFVPETFQLEDVSYDIDFSYDKKELEYLTGLKSDATTTRKQLLSACFYLKQMDRFKKIDLKKLSNRELLALFKKYGKSTVNRFTSSAIIDHFALGTDELIAVMIRKKIKSINK